MKRKKEYLIISMVLLLVISIIIVAILIVNKFIGESDFELGNFFNKDKKQVESLNTEVDVEIKPKYDQVEYSPYISKDGLWGFKDEQGQTVITPRYEEANYFSEGLALVRSNRSYGYIDKTGEFVIEPKFYMANEFSSGVAITKNEDGDNEIIDYDGRIVGLLGKEYSITNFKQNRSIANKNNKYGIINKRGEIIAKIKYDFIEEFNKGYAIASRNKKTYLVNKNGQEVLENYKSFDNIQGDYILAHANDKQDVYDLNLNKVNFDDNIFILKIIDEGVVFSRPGELEYGLLGFDGEVKIEPKFVEIYEFDNELGFARISMDNTYPGDLVLIDLKGNIVKDLSKYNSYFYLRKENDFVILDNVDKVAILDKSMNEIGQFMDARIETRGNFLKVFLKNENQSFIYNNQGKLIYKCNGEIMFELKQYDAKKKYDVISICEVSDEEITVFSINLNGEILK